MKNNLIKIVLLISILLLIFGSCTVYAAGFTDPVENPGFWEPTIEDDSALTSKAGKVLGIINVIGVVTSVIVLMILGIKYMLGSIEEKAEYKKAMIPYVIGVFLLTSSTTLPNIIYTILNTEGFLG